MTTVKDRIKSLVDRHQAIVASARNRQNQLKYEDFSSTARDQFRPHPKPGSGFGFENVPIVVDIQNNYFAELFGFDLRHYYQEPACFVENYLKMNIARYEFVRDDRVFRNEISILVGHRF